MNLNKYDFKVLNLTNQFYTAYPRSQYIEILDKKERPYNCITFEINMEYFMCIPYRSQIRHKYAYHFRNSSRSRKNKSGLDYTKMVIVKDTTYLGSVQAIIDKDEYVETVTNIDKIKDDALEFLEIYKKHINGDLLLHQSEFRRRYQFSPLIYFHEELGL